MMIARFKGSNSIRLLEGNADVVQPLFKTVLAERVNIKRERFTAWRGDLLFGQVDIQRIAFVRINFSEQLIDDLGIKTDQQQPVLERVIVEDIREAWRDDRTETEVLQCPRGVLARATAAKVIARDQHLRPFVARLVEDELGVERSCAAILTRLPFIKVAKLIEQVGAEPRPLDGLEELLRNDEIGVHVGAIKRCHEAGHASEFFHANILRTDCGQKSGGSRQRFRVEITDIDKMARNRCCRCHGRADEVRTTAVSLTSFEVAVGRRGTVLTVAQLVGVHRQAHGATRFTPFKPCLDQNTIKTFLLSLFLDQPRPRHHHRQLDGRCNMATFRNARGFTDVFDTTVGARTDKHFVYRDIRNFLIRFKAHVFKRTFDAATARFVRFLGRIRHGSTDRQDHFRTGAPADLRLDIRCVNLDDAIEVSILIGDPMLPALNGRVPLLRLRCKRAALDIVDGGLVDGDKPYTRPRFDRHVAHRHTAFHAKAADRATSKLNGIAGTASRTDAADYGQHDILRRDTSTQFALDTHQHVLHLLLDETLCGQHMLDLGRTDTV
ncbi:diguanylate cyclase/phosphodiesterase with PAS/PAC and GAF sensor [Zymobacter palmae]|uniref:Diguanylate cyclase/phosphodiesterase with PAS/PAC and GAF sensor n=1 Tax=Zymobacter palmae TaxID=33074 RepID=A0A348HE24_9GAMM|nr:diguanylate cyclase/phosphodiesterase with PAS/PAC and GAF sensor [Zymobacter palmae]